MPHRILADIGQFSESDSLLFNQYATTKTVDKGERLLKEGQICQSAFYILSGSFYQYRVADIGEDIIDLHLENEWMFNTTSLIRQSPSDTGIQAFAKSEVVELPLGILHTLIGKSAAFLQFGRIFNQDSIRTYLFDYTLTPAQKYSYILRAKPLIASVFPVKMIASYLKIAPETLSRVRARF